MITKIEWLFKIKMETIDKISVQSKQILLDTTNMQQVPEATKEYIVACKDYL